MDKTLGEILGSYGVSQEDINTIQEAFDKKNEENRVIAEAKVREELALRFEHDKNNLVEAADRLLSDVVNKFEAEQAIEVEKLTEARSKYLEAAAANKTTHKAKLKEHMDVAGQFATRALVKEAQILKQKQKELTEAKAQVLEQFNSTVAQVKTDYEGRISKIQDFVVSKLNEELTEFNIDKKALDRSRIELITEGKKKIAEAQAKVVKESAIIIEKMVNASLTSEIKQLHEDIERNRQNDFGKRIFEAFAAEYFSSHLMEGSEIKKANIVNESLQSEISSLKTKLAEQAKASEALNRKVLIAEQKHERTKIMNELLQNLRGENRDVMESMLERVQTSKLRESYNRILPSIAKKSVEKKTSALLESEKTAMKTVTGDQRNTRLLETSIQQEESFDNDAELKNIIKLSGIDKR